MEVTDDPNLTHPYAWGVMTHHDCVHHIFVFGLGLDAGPDGSHYEAHNDRKQNCHQNHPNGPHQGLPPSDGIVRAPSVLHCRRDKDEEAPQVLLWDAHID